MNELRASIQVMVYVRQSEKPVIDHVLMERLQSEVVQLRGMMLKLKEANEANKPDDGTKQKAFQRIKLLESQLETEKLQVGSYVPGTCLSVGQLCTYVVKTVHINSLRAFKVKSTNYKKL